MRKLANDNDVILIFDECTSGFRKTNGGLHKFYGVEPDIAIFERHWAMAMLLLQLSEK